MATGNMLLGLSRKKLGDIVFYRSEGQQRARVRVRKIKNPRTAKQALQRMVLSTAAKMAAAFEPIVNHSFEGVAYGTPSVRRFRSLAMGALRNAAAANIAGDGNAPVADFAIKGAPVVGLLQGLQISHGSLPALRFGSLNNVSLAFSNVVPASAITSEVEYDAFLSAMGFEQGDQITAVLVAQSTDVVASAGNAVNTAQRVVYARRVFKKWADLISGLEAPYSIAPFENNNIFEESSMEGTLTISSSQGTTSLVMDAPGGYSGALCGVIRTHVSSDGRYQYNTARLIADKDTLDYNNADDVIPSYMDGVVDIEIGDTRYLQQAVATAY